MQLMEPQHTQYFLSRWKPNEMKPLPEMNKDTVCVMNIYLLRIDTGLSVHKDKKRTA